LTPPLSPTIGPEDARVEASFCEAISTAKEQKAVSVERRAEATYAEYGPSKRDRGKGTYSGSLFGNFLQRRLPFKACNGLQIPLTLDR